MQQDTRNLYLFRTTLPQIKSGAKGLLTGLGINKFAQSKKKSKK